MSHTRTVPFSITQWCRGNNWASVHNTQAREWYRLGTIRDWRKCCWLSLKLNTGLTDGSTTTDEIKDWFALRKKAKTKYTGRGEAREYYGSPSRRGHVINNNNNNNNTSVGPEVHETYISKILSDPSYRYVTLESYENDGQYAG